MFGELVSVQLFNEEEYALITYKDIISAFFAQQSLNNYYLNKHNVHLMVRWIPKENTQQGNKSG